MVNHGAAGSEGALTGDIDLDGGLNVEEFAFGTSPLSVNASSSLERPVKPNT